VSDANRPAAGLGFRPVDQLAAMRLGIELLLIEARRLETRERLRVACNGDERAVDRILDVVERAQTVAARRRLRLVK